MSVDDLVAKWRREKPTDIREEEVFRVLSELGFTVKTRNPQSKKRKKGTHGYTAFHPDLEGCDYFKTRRITVNTHTEGRQGQISVRTLDDIFKAYTHIRRVQSERNELQGE